MVNSTSNERKNKGTFASIIGICVNILLATGKIVTGVLFGLISVLTDGLNNLTDCGSSIISLISFKLSAKPADKEHPYGHERIEYVCSMAVAFIILFVAVTMAIESINKIITPTEVEFSLIVAIVLIVSMLFKLGLFLYYRYTSKKINSSILKATALDSLTDCISTFLVLVCLVISYLTNFNADGYAGILVSVFIGYSGIGVLSDVFSMLIGKAPDANMLKEIKEKILSYPNVLGVHDLSVYCYGPNKYFASAHVEVDAKVDVLDSHELVDKIEKEFLETTGIVLTGHLDPIVIDDERVNFLREKTQEFLIKIDDSFSLHDFRMVFGKNQTNVLFDVAVPYDCKLSKEEIKNKIETEIKKIDEKYCLVITIEPCI
ncbi:MAG: cation transporter [Clostridia bacterium]|nr:cation transporter [Clostridia bacterium]